MTPGFLRTLSLLVRRSLAQHRAAAWLTMLSVALATGLSVSVLTIRHQSQESFYQGGLGFDAVLGARGSQLQLVLNAVYHLEVSQGNIPYTLYQTIKADPRVSAAVPIALGDNYYGYRIVGTKLEYFEQAELADGSQPRLRAGGRLFDPSRMEGVLGSTAAARTGLRVGDIFKPYHGLTFQEGTQHEEEYVVTGIIETTNTPLDRIILIPIEGIYRMGGHVLRGSGEEYTAQAGKEIDDLHKEVSAVLLKLKSPQAGLQMAQQINSQGNVATLAFPVGRVVAELFSKLGWAHAILTVVAYMTVGVAVTGVAASLYSTIHGRRRDIAIMRALGARRRTIFASIMAESAAICAGGALLGLGLYAAITMAASQLLQRHVGIAVDALAWHPALLATPLAVVLAGTLAGILPAVQAYRTNVLDNLQPTT